MIGVGFCVSAQFAAQTQVRRLLSDYNKKNNGDGSLSLIQVALAGSAAGLANSPLSTPIEHIRIRLQTQYGKSSNPFSLISEIIKNHGFRAVFKGWNSTLIREIPGYGFYFLSYEYALRKITPKGKSVNDLNSLSVLACGAFGGFGMWITCYPFDVVKSRIQADRFGKVANYKGTWDCYRFIFKNQGIRGFYVGLVPCLLRAFPVNGATFLAYEWSMRAMGGRKV